MAVGSGGLWKTTNAGITWTPVFDHQASYSIGVVANILQSLRLPNGNIKVLVEGVVRARVIEWKEHEDHLGV